MAAKQHAELGNTLDLIEVLPPGLSRRLRSGFRIDGEKLLWAADPA
jgi:hypothetical protein